MKDSNYDKQNKLEYEEKKDLNNKYRVLNI